MSNNNILKEAILDAKAVRATALANAKSALEEAFSPRLEAIISEKIVAEMEDEMEAPESEDTEEMESSQTEEAPEMETSEEESSETEEAPETEASETDSTETESSQETEAPKDEVLEGEEEIDPDLAEVLLELENEVSDEGNSESEEPNFESNEEEEVKENVVPPEEIDEVEAKSDEDEEINIDEILAELENDCDDSYSSLKEAESDEESEEKHNKEKSEMEEKIQTLMQENANYQKAVTYMREKLNEVNLLNAKLLYTNKLFKGASLNNSQKMKIVENMDLTKSVREVKLVYATLAESLNFGGLKNKKAITETKKVPSVVKTLTEGLASKQVASTKPTESVLLTEGAEMTNRFQKLAGIRVRK